MIKLAVVTATRAEYGLLSPLIRELRNKEDNNFIVDLIVTGTHLSEKFGMTIDEIKERIDYKISVSVRTESETDISNNQAEVLVKFTELFFNNRYNAVVLLGDRYETLAVAIAAGNTRTPIFHLCGGDVTEGAIDEWIRHSITKMSYLHFVTNKDSEKRVIQLGEHPDRVFNYGSTSVDNIYRVADMSKKQALDSVMLNECRYALCTYHPVTMEYENVDYLIGELFKAIKAYPEIQFIITKANADQGGARINDLLDEANDTMSNVHVFSSLGVRRYLSLMRYADFVIGNSSSGIIETPVFQIPTVNIGDRQRGRTQTDNIINCGSRSKEIISAINKALSEEHKKICREVVSPYGDGHASEMISNKIYEFLVGNKIGLKKGFYTLLCKKEWMN